MKTALFFLSFVAYAQPVLINAGGPAVASFQADKICSGSIWKPGVPGYDSRIGTGIWSDLVYGPSFSCDLQVPNGLYRVVLDLEENRNADGLSGAVGTGTRVFQITLNGISTGVMDLFALAGPQTQYQRAVFVEVGSGHLTLNASASVGNAVLSAFEAYRIPPPPLQVSEISSVCGLVVGLQDGSTRCVPLGPNMAITPTGGQAVLTLGAPVLADWRRQGDGFDYMVVRRQDGTQVTRLGIPFPVGVPSPPDWAPVQ